MVKPSLMKEFEMSEEKPTRTYGKVGTMSELQAEMEAANKRAEAKNAEKQAEKDARRAKHEAEKKEQARLAAINPFEALAAKYGKKS
jgi:SpoVK/Ycf46/Vps4 family AAA+-type ATPase